MLRSSGLHRSMMAPLLTASGSSPGTLPQPLWQPGTVVRLSSDDLTNATALRATAEREMRGLLTTAGQGDTFVFYDPDGVTFPEQRFPFRTPVIGDRYDAASKRDRDEQTYWVNLGVDRQTYEELLEPAPR